MMVEERKGHISCNGISLCRLLKGRAKFPVTSFYSFTVHMLSVDKENSVCHVIGISCASCK